MHASIGARRPARFFFYGTLRDAARVNAVVGPASGWRRVAAGSISGRMYDVGPYPALRPGRTAAERVRGVVIEFANGAAALPLLDAYEEAVAATLYVRRRCRVRLTNGRTLTAWVYVYNRPVTGLQRIAGGDWMHR
ncbi:MAG: gamma-glutamylcyclotransferase [Deltaproteobacteria bacterium]|nr:gamma-glutamylcyclotransferase [Deltaproteobacteria bacterium]MBI3389575.1 gamma-glutamylcyclotransferase [Deltaproteobacteria bacterium]